MFLILLSLIKQLFTVHSLALYHHSGLVSQVQYNSLKATFQTGKKTVRLVSFQPGLRAKTENAKTKGEEVAITNCSIRKRRGQDEELEIIAGDKSSLIKSSKRFHIDESLLNMPTTYDSGTAVDVSALASVNGLGINQHVNITAKVTCIRPRESIRSQGKPQTLLKQDVLLADDTAVCRCVLWEHDVG